MIYLAYNLFRYKFDTKENKKYQDWTISLINKHFPNEDYVLPYSQNSRDELVKKLKCEDTLIQGTFYKDLIVILGFCKKLVFFPTDGNYIGCGIFLEITVAKKLNLPIYCYNQQTNDFSLSFEIINPPDFCGDSRLESVFHKKIILN